MESIRLSTRHNPTPSWLAVALWLSPVAAGICSGFLLVWCWKTIRLPKVGSWRES